LGKKTCIATLSNGPSDVLSEYGGGGDDDDVVGNESYRDF
jgi:hypothetical protein